MNTVKEFFNRLAPGWNAAEKHTKEEIKDYITERLPIKKGMKVLDVGCGTGIITDALYDLAQNEVTAIDVSDEMIKIAKQTLAESTADFVCADFYEFSPKDKYDYVVCFNAYPHFIDSKKFVRKANELLVRGGICAIMHNFAREKLATHHRALSENVSRTIGSAEEEASRFSEFFDVMSTVDNSEEYLILLKKR